MRSPLYIHPLVIRSLAISPGFFSRLKEKGAMAKETWGVIGSAYVLTYPGAIPGLT